MKAGKSADRKETCKLNDNNFCLRNSQKCQTRGRRPDAVFLCVCFPDILISIVETIATVRCDNLFRASHQIAGFKQSARSMKTLADRCCRGAPRSSKEGWLRLVAGLVRSMVVILARIVEIEEFPGFLLLYSVLQMRSNVNQNIA